MQVETDYLSQRASEERTAAVNAADENVRQVHIELAERYEEAARLNAREKRRTLRIVS